MAASEGQALFRCERLIKALETRKAAFQKLLLPLSVLIYTLILYNIFPDSLQIAWKGRLIYAVFLWVLSLELVLSWKNISFRKNNLKTWFLGIIILSLPFTYIICVYHFGFLNQVIELGRLLGVPPISNESFIIFHWPLSYEIMLFSLSMLACISLMYGINAVKRYLISLTILIGTATFYLIDTFFPYTAFYPLQAFVPVTTYTVAALLQLCGYKVIVLYNSVLYVAGGKHLIPLIAINWPCAGVQSLLIYSLVVFLFLKNLKITMERKIIYFTIGAVGTFFTNILRIFTFFWLGLNYGANIGMLFHDYYGEIYFLTWLPLYFLIIVYGKSFLNRMAIIFRKICTKLESTFDRVKAQKISKTS